MPNPVHHVKMADDTYRVYEHKSDHLMMVAPSWHDDGDRRGS
ncbi:MULTISPECIES: hypothetical protein [Sinorhizobium]|nr:MULTISPECIES: hypothetical protein [Sinorhizobium]